MTAGPSRAQAGLDRLVLFVLALVVVLLVAPTVLGLFGIDVVGGDDEQAKDSEGAVVAGEADGPIQILGARGTEVDADDQTVGAVELTVAPGATDESVDLREYTLTWVGDRSYQFVPENADGGDGTFEIDDPVLRDPGNQTTIRVDVAGTQSFDGPLTAGEHVTVVLSDQRGQRVRHELTVPDPIPDEPSIRL